MAAYSNMTFGNATSSDVAGQVVMPKLDKKIDLTTVGSSDSTVKKMTFSPDGRYLGIVESPDILRTDIVVWDLQLGKAQSHIHCAYNFAALPGYDLLWNRDGTVISFGAAEQWDAMTGAALPNNPAVGQSAKLNRDGSKLLTIMTKVDGSYIYVYDTKTWALQKLYLDGLTVETAAWTADDRILAGVSVTRNLLGQKFDVRTVTGQYDTAMRLIDPSNKEVTKAVWFPAESTGDPKSPFTYAFPIGSHGISNFVTNQLFLDAGFVIDGTTLKVSRYQSFDKDDIAPGSFGMGFSGDGRYLYLKGASFSFGGHAAIKNSVVDVASGTPVLQFRGAMDNEGGLAVSPDGKHLALGDADSISIFNLQ